MSGSSHVNAKATSGRYQCQEWTGVIQSDDQVNKNADALKNQDCGKNQNARGWFSMEHMLATKNVENVL